MNFFLRLLGFKDPKKIDYQVKVRSTVQPDEPQDIEVWLTEHHVGITRRFMCENDISSAIPKEKAE